jgi:hypothetical protein
VAQRARHRAGTVPTCRVTAVPSGDRAQHPQ